MSSLQESVGGPSRSAPANGLSGKPRVSPRLSRLGDLTEPQRRLVLALIDGVRKHAARSADGPRKGPTAETADKGGSGSRLVRGAATPAARP